MTCSASTFTSAITIKLARRVSQDTWPQWLINRFTNIIIAKYDEQEKRSLRSNSTDGELEGLIVYSEVTRSPSRRGQNVFHDLEYRGQPYGSIGSPPRRTGAGLIPETRY